MGKSHLDELRIERDDRPETGSRVWFWLLLLLLLLGAGYAGWRWLGTRPVPVTTVVVNAAEGAGGRRTVLNGSGYVTARRQATVSSKVTGKIVDVMIEEGMSVKEGQVLARLDASNAQTVLRLVEAQVAAAQAARGETAALLIEAQQDLKRLRALLGDGISSQAELDRALAQAASLEARLAAQGEEVKVAERQVALRKQEMEDLVIRAPFDGVVVAKNAQPGEMISPISAGGGFTRTGIGTIVDMSSLEIEVDVNESFINRVQPGQKVVANLDAYSDWDIPAEVIAIIPAADRQKATVRVRIGFEQLDPRILPEMGVKVAFREDVEPSSAAAASLRIPKEAISRDGNREVVWVVNEHRVERRAIQTGGESEGHVMVLAGLQPGERVVVAGLAQLKEGTKVQETKR